MKKIIYYLAVLIIISTQSIFSQLEFIQLQRIPEEHKIFRLLNSIVADIKTAKINLGDYTVLLTRSSKWSFSKTNKKDGGENNITQLFENKTFSDIEIIPISTVIKSDIAEVSFNIIVTTEFGYMEESLILYFVKESERWVLNDDDSSQRFLYCLEKNYIPVPTESITTFTIFESNKTLIPYKIYNDPDIWDLNKNVTWNYFGKWLFANNSAIDMDMHWYSTNWPYETAVFYLDPYWQRIVYTKYNSTDIKAFNLEFYPGAEYPSEPWGITTDDWGNIYVSDKRNDCLVKLVYVPSANSMYFSGKFTIPELDGPTDVIYSSHDTPNNSIDDYFLIANKNARNIIKTDINGNVLNTITQFKSGGTYNFISPVRITQVPNSTYIAILDDVLNYVIVGYIDNTGTLICHNVINFGGYLNPTDVGTNCYGDILVSDENNQIHKFNIIGEYLCTYISNAFHFPLRFSRVNDLEYYIFDQNCADRWSPDHGIKRFIPGSDAFKLAYNQSSTNHLFYYTLSDYSQVKLEIINSNNQVIFTKNCGGRISGRRTETVSMNEIPIGNYTYRINYKPLHNELYGSYQQDWRYSEIQFNTFPVVEIIGPTSAQRHTTSTFTCSTNVQGATYLWEQMPICCTLAPDCGVYNNIGNGSSLSIYNTGYHYYLRLKVTSGPYTAQDVHYVNVEYCIPNGGGGGCPTLAFDVGGEMTDDNPLLITSLSNPGVDVTDYYLVQNPITPIGNKINLRIHEPQTEHTWLDYVELIEAKVKSDELVAVNDEGEIINYKKLSTPVTVLLNGTTDITFLLAEMDTLDITLSEGDVLTIQGNAQSSEKGDVRHLVLGGIDPIKNHESITLSLAKKDDNNNEDNPRFGSIFLRPNKSIMSKKLRNLPPGDIEITINKTLIMDYLTIAQNIKTAKVKSLNLLSANHILSGDVKAMLTSIDQNYAEIIPGEIIDFEFQKGNTPAEKTAYILKAAGRYETDTTLTFNKLTSSVPEEIIPKENKLFDNYPNPFNPTTQIKYSVKENGMVTLKVYDVLGKEVTTLVNEEMQAGTYTVTFDAGSIASGIYFYSISVNDYQKTKKMLLIK